MTWDKYSKDVQDQLKNNPAIINAINTMCDAGHDKEYCQKITGAPYEMVDKLYKHRRGRAISRESGPRREEED